MRKVALYVRHSTDQQEGSTVSQIDELQRYCAQNNREVVRIFEDKGQSGTSFLKRPAFVEMLKLVESGKADFDEILVYDESRWGRGVNPRENSYWKMHLERFGVLVNVINSRSTRGNDIGSYVVEVVESAEASEYSKKLSRATLRGMKDNARKGFSSGGTPPYGYRRIAVDKVTGIKTRDLQPGEHVNADSEKSKWDLGDPLEVQVVKRIFAEKVKGIGDVTIADMLNKECISPPRLGRWRNQDGRWSGGTIRTILRNCTYTGTYVYNVHPQSHLKGPEKEAWINKKEDWITTENAFPAVISRELFDLANRDRQEYKRKNRYSDVSPYLLTGMIRCSHCGGTFYGQKQKNIRYYEDSTYVSRGRSACTSYTLNKEKIETFVVRSIRQKILNSELLVRLERMLEDNFRHNSVERLSGIEQYEKALSDVKIKLERLFTLYENRVATESLIERIAETDKEKKKIEQKLEEMRLSNTSRKEIVEAKKEVEHLMQNFEMILSSAALPIQKELIRKFVHSITVNRETDNVEVYLKAIPTLKTGPMTTASCIKAEKRWNKKVKQQSADKVQQTEAATETNTEVEVFTKD